MSKQNKNNRIIFLTTLSVYLGLVLVGGASPQILAQTVNSIKAECDWIELEKNAHKNFSKLGIKGDSIPFLPSQIEHAFDETNLTGFFDIDVLLDFSAQGNPKYTVSLETDKHYQGSSQSKADELFEGVIRIAEEFGRRSCVAGQKKCSPLSVKIKLDTEEFSVEISFSQNSSKQAKEFVDAYQLLIDAEVCRCIDCKSDQYEKLLNNNTKATSENNQVFIVTRLPRGSLDKLSKQDAKADNQ